MPSVEVTRRQPGIAQVTMNRPKVFNAFDEAMIAELDAAFAQLTDASDVRLIVLAGDGNHFSTGADLKWMQRASKATQEANVADARRFAAMLARIGNCPKPTLARVQGSALGGGVGLACACDIAVAADNARFSVSEVRFGILPAVIGPYLVNALGKRQAMRLALTAARIGAAEALSIGLVQQVAPLERLDDAVDRVLEQLQEGGPNAQREIKRLFAKLEVGTVTPDVREFTAQTIGRVRAGDEAKEGFDAFFAKRPAAWVPAETRAERNTEPAPLAELPNGPKAQP
jgi:methylglutaconyl-CoA hydratase